MKRACAVRAASLCLALGLLLASAAFAETIPLARSGMSQAQARAIQLATAKRLGLPLTIKNSLGMEFVLIPAGTFVMGSPSHEPRRDHDEGPQHLVRISKPFYLQTTEVTQAQWKAVMGDNPSHFKGDDRRPVESVSFNYIQYFIDRLNRREGAVKYRLPTEAQWEYACRAGSRTCFNFGDSESQLDAHAWHLKNSGGKPHRVAFKRPNWWGLYDMHGNVHEWCSDKYRDYPGAPATAPTDPEDQPERITRGGGWGSGLKYLRCAYRSGHHQGFDCHDLGFRLARDP